MRICVVQLCRLGDIVQTLPTLAALREAGHEVDLVVREGFEKLPIPADVASTVHVFPAAGDARGGVAARVSRLETVAAFIAPLRERGYDLAINLSHDETSARLTALLGASSTKGVTYSRERSSYASDPWTQYLLTIPSNRRAGAFNLSYVYARLGDTSIRDRSSLLTVSERARREARALLSLSNGARPATVGLVPGASDARKRWPAPSYGAVAAALSREGLGSVVLGTADERAVAGNVVAASGGAARNLAGETPLWLLLGVLATLDLVITNDTGTMHLAAAVGTRTLTTTLGPAAAHESAPFAHGHVSLEPELHCFPCDFASYCADPVCHALVTPAVVSDVALAMLRGDQVSTPAAGTARAYRTHIDASGRLEVLPVGRYRLHVEDVMRLAYRRLWESALGAGRAPVAAVGPEAIRSRWSVDDSSQVCERLDAVVAQVSRIATAADVAGAELLEALGDGAGESAATAIDQLSETLVRSGELEPLLRPLTAFASMQLQLSGSREPRQVLTNLLQAASGAANRARLMERLVSELSRDVREAAAPVAHRAG